MTIGFDETLYSVDEASGEVGLGVSILSGTLSDNLVVVRVTTMERTATGKHYLCTYSANRQHEYHFHDSSFSWGYCGCVLNNGTCPHLIRAVIKPGNTNRLHDTGIDFEVKGSYVYPLQLLRISCQYQLY